jgi:hypothetical protein
MLLRICFGVDTGFCGDEVDTGFCGIANRMGSRFNRKSKIKKIKIQIAQPPILACVVTIANRQSQIKNPAIISTMKGIPCFKNS